METLIELSNIKGEQLQQKKKYIYILPASLPPPQNFASSQELLLHKKVMLYQYQKKYFFKNKTIRKIMCRQHNSSLQTQLNCIVSPLGKQCRCTLHLSVLQQTSYTSCGRPDTVSNQEIPALRLHQAYYPMPTICCHLLRHIGVSSTVRTNSFCLFKSEYLEIPLSSLCACFHSCNSFLLSNFHTGYFYLPSADLRVLPTVTLELFAFIFSQRTWS